MTMPSAFSPMWPQPNEDAPDIMLAQAREAAGVVAEGQAAFVHPGDPTQTPFDALRTRMIGYRTYAGQLERLLTEHGIAIPVAVCHLNPDHHA